MRLSGRLGRRGIRVALFAGVILLIVATPVASDPESSTLASADVAVGKALINTLATQTPHKARFESTRGIRFQVAPGRAGPTGLGRPVQRFLVEAEVGIDKDTAEEFAAAVQDRLFDRRSWSNRPQGVNLQRVSSGRVDFRVALTKASSVDQMCAPLATGGIVSCAMGRRAIINLQRWRKGAPDFPTLEKYRTYVINHEVGHTLGKSHTYCSAGVRQGNIMMQQTFMPVDQCPPARFPHPNASRFATACELSVGTDDGRFTIGGHVSGPGHQEVELLIQDSHGAHRLGRIGTSEAGEFETRLEPGLIRPSSQEISLEFPGDRDQTACSARVRLDPNTPAKP